MHSQFKLHIISAAVLSYCSQASAFLTYGDPDAQGRRLVIEAGGPIEGCDAGLALVNGVYYCSGSSQYIGVITPTQPGKSDGGSGGQIQGGWMGTDGQLHVSPSDNSPTCDCSRELGKTDEKTAQIQNNLNDNDDSDTHADGGGGGGNSRVICTELMRQGMLDKAIWRADLLFTRKHLSPATVRGYHLWAIPYVRLMRRSPWAQNLIRPLATWRAEELAFQMGVRPRCNWKGKFLRWVGEPICFAIGLWAAEQNWQSLWTGRHPLVSADL